jgi:hypothetical protein
VHGAAVVPVVAVLDAKARDALVFGCCGYEPEILLPLWEKEKS